MKKKSETVESLAERITNRLMDGTKTAIEDIIGDNSEIPIRVRNLYKVKDKYKIHDSDYKVLFRTLMKNSSNPFLFAKTRQ